MSTEELTAEESTALEAMQNDEPIELKEPSEAPAASEEPKQQEAKEPEAEKGQDKPPEGFVPHQAMHQERMRARQERERADALEQRIAELEAKASPQQQPPEYADPLVDPDGFRKWAEFNAQNGQQQTEAVQQQIQQQAEDRQLFQKVAEYDRQFTTEQPDYPQAGQFLAQARMQELTQLGYTQPQAQAQLQQDMRAIIQAGEAMGMNPAKLAYMRAQEMGYQAPAAPQPSEAERIQATAQAQEATKGLSSTGPAQTGKLTAQQLADMSEADFAKLTDDQLREVLGG